MSDTADLIIELRRAEHGRPMIREAADRLEELQLTLRLLRGIVRDLAGTNPGHHTAIESLRQRAREVS